MPAFWWFLEQLCLKRQKFWSLPLCFMILSEIRRVDCTIARSVRFSSCLFLSYITSCWYSNFVLSFISSKLLSFLSVEPIWHWMLIGSIYTVLDLVNWVPWLLWYFKSNWWYLLSWTLSLELLDILLITGFARTWNICFKTHFGKLLVSANTFSPWSDFCLRSSEGAASSVRFLKSLFSRSLEKMHSSLNRRPYLSLICKLL